MKAAAFRCMPGSSRCRLTQRNGGDPPPLLRGHYTHFIATTRRSAPLRRIGTFGLAVGAACAFPLPSPARFSRSVPKPGRASRRLHAGCRSGSIRTSSELIPEAVPTPGTSSKKFRHFADGSLSLASLDPPAGIMVPTFPRRSRPWLLTTAARGGWDQRPDRRTRRALLHLQYSCAAPCGPAMLVTQGTLAPSLPAGRSALSKADLVRVGMAVVAVSPPGPIYPHCGLREGAQQNRR